MTAEVTEGPARVAWEVAFAEDDGSPVRALYIAEFEGGRCDGDRSLIIQFWPGAHPPAVGEEADYTLSLALTDTELAMMAIGALRLLGPDKSAAVAELLAGRAPERDA